MNLTNHTWDLEETKRKTLKTAAQRMARQSKAPPTAIAALAGKFVYSAQGHAGLHGLGKILMAQAATTAARSGAKTRAAQWQTPAPVSQAAAKALTLAAEVLARSEPVVVHNPAAPPTVTLFSDASDTGWGGVFRQLKPNPARPQRPWTRTIAGRWTPNQSALHITKKEALAASFVLRAFLPYINSADRVELKTDAVATRCALLKGSARPAMTWCVHSVRRAYQSSRIDLRVEYVPSAENPADAPSRRERDRNDYRLQPRWLRMAESTLKFTPEIDLFASTANRSTKAFFSKEPQPYSSGENSLAQDWRRLRNPYANPPWPLMGAVLNKARREEVHRLLLVAPEWRGAAWWPLLEAMTVAAITLPKKQSVYLKDGVEVPPPRWATTIRVVTGRPTRTATTTSARSRSWRRST